jgi:hypothetical protein
MRTDWRRLVALCAVVSLLVVAAAVLAGCGTPKPPSDTPGIVGKIEGVEKLEGGEWSILVVGGTQAPGAVSDKASCRITSDTTIVDTAGTEMDPTELSVGDSVAVWFTGAVAESYPVQGTAAYIEVR